MWRVFLCLFFPNSEEGSGGCTCSQNEYRNLSARLTGGLMEEPVCVFQILRELREGLLMSRRDDTYMYDDEMQRLGQHWYDEPPYESDPEDFLMAETAHHAHRSLATFKCFIQGIGDESLLNPPLHGCRCRKHHCAKCQLFTPNRFSGGVI